MKKTLLIFLMVLTVMTGVYVLTGQNNCLNAPDLNRNFYKKALKLEKQGQHKEAYYAYKKVSPFYSAYDAVLLHQSDCAAQIEDEKTAIKKLETLILKFPRSKLTPCAHYKLAQAYVRSGQDKKAEKVLQKIINKYPDSEYKIASYYYLGILNKKKDPKYAISLWKKYIQLSPSGRFAIECINEMKSLKTTFTQQDYVNIGIVYYSNGRYQSAINNFELAPTNASWYYLAKSYQQTKQKDKALLTIKKGFFYYPKNLPKNQLIEMAKLYSLLLPKPKLQTWVEIEAMTRNTKAHDYAIYNLAKASPQQRAKTLYYQAVKENTDSDFASECLWELMWNEYKHHNYQQAIKIAHSHEHKYRNTQSSPKIIFWQGKIYEKQHQKQHAFACYKKLLKEYNTSYYAFRADGRIKSLKGFKDPKWSTQGSNRLSNSIFAPQNPCPSYRIFTKYGESFLELLKIEDYDLISLYQIDDPTLDSWINHQKGLYPKSCLCARNAIETTSPDPDIKDGICKLAFPLHYVEQINKASRQNKIDAAIIISIAKEESYFNPKAKSSANAMGLMQLIPSTATHICKVANLQGGNLYNPQTNIKLGSAYLKYLYGMTGNMLYTVASYNAGPGAVLKWAKNKPSNDLDEFVEDIPYPETQNYVKKVFRSYWCYKRLY